MIRVRHLNCGTLHAPPYPAAACHCLLIEAEAGLTLVDAGIGVADCRDPLRRIGQTAIEGAGFQFDEGLSALRQVESFGFSAEDVRHVVLTHGDPDHAGGLTDFPEAVVHVSDEERNAIAAPHPRYSRSQFEHGPRWRPYGASAERWLGLEVRRLDLDLGAESYLVPLFGHTLGHCGVAVRRTDRWLLHAGDAYYLRGELTDDDHPVAKLAAMRAESDPQRRESLNSLRRLVRDHAGEVEVFGYHDFSEFPVG